MAKITRWQKVQAEWAVLTLYQRFESVVAVVLTTVTALVIVVALYHLVRQVVGGLILGLDPLDQAVFQAVFGELLTVMIALEFNHTLQFVVARKESIIQTKIVLLISLLALARKVIVLDLETVSMNELLGLAALILALGAVYWMMRERDDRLAGLPKEPAG